MITRVARGEKRVGGRKHLSDWTDGARATLEPAAGAVMPYFFGETRPPEGRRATYHKEELSQEEFKEEL